MRRADDQRSLFADAIEIPRWLERDRETRYADRLARDRRIGQSLASSDPLTRVRGWWSRLTTQQKACVAEVGVAAQHLEQGRRSISLMMIVLGALAGAAVAFAVFHYDGRWPVNVVTVLATLGLLQILLIALTLVLMLPRVPGLASLQDLLTGLNPGRLIGAVYRRVRGGDAELNVLLEWRAARGPAAARFARWQMLAWSQMAAVAFNLAVLAVAGGLIAFTDLAFGWSTTLRLDAAQALRITDAISAPWRAIWPQAVPDAALIEQSRYFRLVTARPDLSPADTLTGWWPFLVAAIVTYGLVPRCALLALALWRLRRATRHLLLDDPGVRGLLDRMQSAAVALGAAEPEVQTGGSATSASAPAPREARAATAIVWAEALEPDTARAWAGTHLAWHVIDVQDAGGGRTLAQDRALIERLAGERASAVLVFVRAWEAPLLDLKDFLSELRAGLGAQVSLIVVPVGADGALATAQQRMVWSRWAGRMADPALYLETGA